LGHYRFAHLLPGTYVIGVIAHPWWQNFVAESMVVSKSGAQFGASGDVALPATQIPPSVAANPALDVVYPVTYFPSAASLAEASNLSLKPGATETADMTLRPVPSIHLHVRVPPATPAANQTDGTDGGQIDAVPADSGTNVEVFLNADGAHSNNIEAFRTGISLGLFELSGIPPGDITVVVSGSQGGNDSTTTRTQSLKLSANMELDLTPHGPLADVSGVVLTNVDVTETQKEVAGLISHAGRLIFMLEFRSRKTAESYKTSISSKGEFSFAGSALPPGTYDVDLSDEQSPLQVSSLEATGATVSRRTIDVPAGQPVKLTVHIAEAKGSVAGVALKDGEPFAGAMILLVPQDPDQNPSQFHRDQSDSDRSFSMSPIFPGRYTLLALENGWDLEWSNPAVLFQYLPNGLPVELKPDASVNLNAKVQ
jgi:hypothetical protein